MAALNALPPSIRGSSPELESGPSIPPSPAKLAFLKVVGDNAVRLEVRKMRSLGLYNGACVNSRFSRSIKSMNDHASVSEALNDENVLVWIWNFDENDALVIRI